MRSSVLFGGSQLCVACRMKASSQSATMTARQFSTAILPSSRQARTEATLLSLPHRRQSRILVSVPAASRWLSSSPQTGPGAAAAQSQQPQNPREQRRKIPQYYALFPDTLPQGPPPSGPFQIDLSSLRREFLRLQAASHPDFHHSGGSTQSSDEISARRRAEVTSSLINAAYKTLSSPLLRAQYLLHELYGVDLAGDESGQEAGDAADAEVLTTVLEAREKIEEAEREEDLVELRKENEERIKLAEERMGKALEKDGPQEVEEAKKEAVRLRYWVNIRESVDNWEKGKPVVLQH
ncbi:hypothetical protein B0H66DRAFT_74316 [Apodospora peruviana]|uniref:Co-chaperone HscB C-terminal oligomerisation domain-containing protein n=1 Tax=Apodospora peruviana TaxID=516989 RepID=A0AAE0IT39_9PEZI|nr:hypothetical protein B0H66DRAFT_74316 [Apodospora peruviana]